jgi:nitrate reductase assembly molybdenum cofactor insertion protein NarJ
MGSIPGFYIVGNHLINLAESQISYEEDFDGRQNFRIDTGPNRFFHVYPDDPSFEQLQRLFGQSPSLDIEHVEQLYTFHYWARDGQTACQATQEATNTFLIEHPGWKLLREHVSFNDVGSNSEYEGFCTCTITLVMLVPAHDLKPTERELPDHMPVDSSHLADDSDDHWLVDDNPF